MYALMARRVYDATAVTDPEVAVHLDGNRIDAKSFERYVDLYLGSRGEAGRAYERINDGWEVAVATSDGTGLQQVSFVNGVATLRGGKHVDHIVQQICKRLGDTIQSRRKDVTVRPQYIRDGMFVFVRATVPNPTFDSQSKETLTTPVSKFGGGGKIELSDKFIDKIYKLDGLVDRVAGLSDAAGERGLKKTDGAKRSTVYGIKKLDDAEWAGTAKSSQCTLILTEGDRCAGWS
jgi:DNA topoisomerase-2